MHPCLITVDIQVGFHEPYWGKRNNPMFEERVADVLAFWRGREWPVIHVQHLSVNPESPLHPSRPGVNFMDSARPKPGERFFQKQVNSAFIGTNLEAVLREQKQTTLVFAGLTTDHCVSTSVRMAANLGFAVTVLSDATAAFGRTGRDGTYYEANLVHEVSLASLDGEFARVVDSSFYLRN